MVYVAIALLVCVVWIWVCTKAAHPLDNSVQGSGAPVRAGKEEDAASRFAMVDVDAAVTHPNDAVANDAQDKDDATLATIKDEATNTSSTDAVALDVAIIDVEVGVTGTEVGVEAAEQKAAIPGGDDVEEAWSVEIVLLVCLVGIWVCTHPLDDANTVQDPDVPLSAGVINDVDNHVAEEAESTEAVIDSIKLEDAVKYNRLKFKFRLMELVQKFKVDEIQELNEHVTATTQRLRAR